MDKKHILPAISAALFSLLVFLGQQIYSDSREHDRRITSADAKAELQRDLLTEVRADVKEIRDTVRRMEGQQHALSVNR